MTAEGGMTVTLREHLEALLGALRAHGDEQTASHAKQHEDALRTGLVFWENHQRAHDAEHKAVEQANVALNGRLNGMNEFRGSLKDQQATFITREVYDEKHEALQKRLETMEKVQATDSGSRERSDRATRMFFSVGALALAVLVVIVNVLIKVL